MYNKKTQELFLNNFKTFLCPEYISHEDFKNRCYVQFFLWKIIYDLRNGFFYNDSYLIFIQLLNSCCIFIDTLYEYCFTGDESFYLKKIF